MADEGLRLIRDRAEEADHLLALGTNADEALFCINFIHSPLPVRVNYGTCPGGCQSFFHRQTTFTTPAARGNRRRCKRTRPETGCANTGSPGRSRSAGTLSTCGAAHRAVHRSNPTCIPLNQSIGRIRRRLHRLPGFYGTFPLSATARKLRRISSVTSPTPLFLFAL